MNHTLLAIDIGNTTTELGLFQGEALKGTWRISSETRRTADECWQLISFYLDEFGISRDQIEQVAIASVVPFQTRCIQHVSSEYLSLKPLVINVESCPFLKVNYNDPTQVGADRLCNAFAGFYHYGGPLIVVDFGTALTFDVVSEDGTYQGGVILPGPQTTSQALHRRTAMLPQVPLTFPESLIGKTTENAIQTGLTWGMVDMVDGLIERISREMKQKPKVICTGGLSKPYAANSRSFQIVHEDLVLEGIRLIAEKKRREQN